MCGPSFPRVGPRYPLIRSCHVDLLCVDNSCLSLGDPCAASRGPIMCWNSHSTSTYQMNKFLLNEFLRFPIISFKWAALISWVSYFANLSKKTAFCFPRPSFFSHLSRKCCVASHPLHWITLKEFMICCSVKFSFVDFITALCNETQQIL